MAGRFFATCLLIAAAAAAPCVGQTKTRPGADGRRQPRADVVNELLDRARSVEEPTLRAFLQLQLARFLWEEGSAASGERAALAASEAMETLQGREKEMPRLYHGLFRRELIALVNTHDRQLAARLAERHGLERTSREQIETAFAMLDTPGNADAAAERVRQSLRGGEPPDQMLSFFLHRLAQEKPSALAPVLSDLLALEERKPGTLPLGVLSTMRQFCVAAGAPPELKARFFAAAVAAARASVDAPDRAQIARAHTLLRNTLPAIAETNPALHAQASALLASLSAGVPQTTAERADVSARVAQSGDELAQTLSEAEATKDAGHREQLLTDAAQLALKKDQLKAAVEIAMRIESEEKNFPQWRDQFLGQVADRALAKKDAASAEAAAAKIGAPLARAAVLQKISLHLFESDEIARARETMGEVVRLALAADDGVAKARVLLETIPAFARIDSQRTPEVARSAVKIINGLPEPAAGEKPESAARVEHAKGLMTAAYHVIPAFRSLARQDEQGALGLAESVRQKGLKAVALFGVYSAPPPADATAADAKPAAPRN